MKKLLLILFLTLFNLNAALAQVTPVTPITPPPPVDFTKTNSALDKISVQLTSGKVTSKQTNEFLQNINQIQEQINLARTQATTNLDNVQKKINALGAAPEEGQKEPSAIAKQRKEFTTQADNFKSQIAQADLVKTKIEELSSLILKVRNQELLNNILAKQSSILHPQEFWDSLVSFAGFIYDIAKSPLNWYQGMTPQKQTLVKSNILYVVLSMLIALIAAIYLSRYIKKWFGYKSNIERPDYSQKVRAALWMLVARGLIPSAFFGAFLLWQKNNTIINDGDFGILLRTAALYLLYYYLAKAIVRVTFTPFSPKWRIIEVNDDKAASLNNVLIFSIAAICIVSFFQTLATEMNYNTDIIYSLKIFANAVKAFCIIIVAKKFLYDNQELSEAQLAAADKIGEDGEQTNIGELTTSSKISLAITFLMIAAFGLSLFGYIRLSEFIVNRFIISALVIGGFYIADKLIRVLFHQILLFKFWIRTFRINRRTLVKTEFWFGLILKPILGIMAILVLLAVWGVSVDILIRNIKNFLVGFNIGGIRISITSILLGLLTFFISMGLVKLLKNSFLTGSLSKIEMEDGVRNSVISIIGFIGFIISVIVAIAVMGGSFASLAIIAGALSFGAGLGLQNMVSNLVSGMTILFERPIKIGDWVIVDGQEGIVKNINMRSTEIETWSKATVIVPNSDILSKSLINLTYSNRMGRAEINVGVSYDSDIELVKKTLLEIAAATPNVSSNPAPSVGFTDLGDNSLNFQLRCFTSNVYTKSGIMDTIREAIVNRFKELGIEIPFPQLDVHLFNKTENQTIGKSFKPKPEPHPKPKPHPKQKLEPQN